MKHFTKPLFQSFLLASSLGLSLPAKAAFIERFACTGTSGDWKADLRVMTVEGSGQQGYRLVLKNTGSFPFELGSIGKAEIRSRTSARLVVGLTPVASIEPSSNIPTWHERGEMANVGPLVIDIGQETGFVSPGSIVFDQVLHTGDTNPDAQDVTVSLTCRRGG